MTLFTKRPGFVRETVGDIDDVVFLDSDEVSIAKVSEATLPYGDLSKEQKAALSRDIEVKTTLNDMRVELRRIAFLLERISGVDIDADNFDVNE